MTTAPVLRSLLALLAADRGHRAVLAQVAELTPEALELEARASGVELLDYLEIVVDTLDQARAAFRGIPEALELRIALRRKAGELETWADTIGAWRRVEAATAQRVGTELAQARGELAEVLEAYRLNPDPINTGRLAVVRGRVERLTRDLAAWTR
jgi:hypothetical protein